MAVKGDRVQIPQPRVCTNRIWFRTAFYDAFTKRLAETAGATKVADEFEPDAVIGPLKT
jgi:hypothetical protein